MRLSLLTRPEVIAFSLLIIGTAIVTLRMTRPGGRFSGRRKEGRGGRAVAAAGGGGEQAFKVEQVNRNDPKSRMESVTFADVAGLDEAISELREVVDYLRDPHRFERLGAHMPKGVLLYGMPGCGKTLLARALAGETGVPFYFVSATSFVEKFVGLGASRVRQLFDAAKGSAPAIIFLDELDAIGHKRSQLTSSSHSVVNQLLDEMDSVGKDNEGIFVLAATNHPWDVDAALRRPGRLDRSVLVLPPDEAARRRVLELGLQDRPVDGLDLDDLARRTNGYSGADLTHLVDSAAELAMAHAVKTGKVRPIGSRDFSTALKDVRPTTQAWFDTAKNYALYANEGGLYDDLLAYLKRH
jgi:ATP-dependent Zn protease